MKNQIGLSGEVFILFLLYYAINSCDIILAAIIGPWQSFVFG